MKISTINMVVSVVDPNIKFSVIMVAFSLSFFLLTPSLLAYVPGMPIPPYFAPPWEIADNHLFFTVTNTTTEGEFNITLNDTDRYIYTTLYYTLDGGAWQPISLTESDTGISAEDGWIAGNASLTIQVPAGTNVGYVIAYTCKWFDNQWRCGCRGPDECGLWSVQQLPLTTARTSGEPDCRMPGNSCPEERPFCNIATGSCDECMRADTSLCGEKEACINGSCTPVECLSNADCVGKDSGDLRRLVCNPKSHNCVACNTHVDCMFLKSNKTDITGYCDFLNHTCSYFSDNELFCTDKCMPSGIYISGRCEGNDIHICTHGSKGCFDYDTAVYRHCSQSCALAPGTTVPYCTEDPWHCARECGADNACNPVCGSQTDIFCQNTPDPDCS